MRAVINLFIILMSFSIWTSIASAKTQTVVTTKAYTLKSRTGSKIVNINQNQELIAESCSQENCVMRLKYNGRTLRFLLKRKDLRQRITDENRLKMRSRGVVGPAALDPAVDTSRAEEAARLRTRERASRTRTEDSGNISFVAPTCDCAYGSCRISSNFGPRTPPKPGASAYHQGLDIAGGAGTPIVAAESGTIIYAGVMGGYGNTIDIDHGGGYKTRYGHMSRFKRRSGWVQQGEVIGYMGQTGRVTGPHLHFEIFKNGGRIDPKPRIDVRTSNISRTCSDVQGVNRGTVIDSNGREIH